MCGILGTVGKIDRHTFSVALNSIAHRGPDGYGIWQEDGGGVTLGHRRLAILDVSENGRQPMHYGDRWVITFNGEIYNFIEIRNQLRRKGYRFVSDSDTEVILAAYQEWGDDCVSQFNGMWALGIWDRQRKRLFLSRDRFGKKPLFYAFTGGQFVFASEMKALFPFLPAVKPAAHFDWCYQHIFAYENTDKCLIEGIKRFPAGHSGYLEGDRISLRRYWNTVDHLVPVPDRYEEQVERFRELFVDACRIRMRSDVPIGTALSGGLDSSAVICTMNHIARSNTADGRVSRDWQHAFVATFPGSFLDEREYAEQVVDHLGIKATYLPVTPGKDFDKLFRYLYLLEDINLTSPVPMIETYKAIRDNGVVVSIDGHGADELLSGYGNSIFHAFLDCGPDYKAVKNILETFQDLRRPDNPQLPFEPWNWGQYWAVMKGNKRNMADLWVKGPVKKMLGIPPADKKSSEHLGHLNHHLYGLFHESIFPTLLRNYDRYAMINGVEIRMPFVDYRLVSYCFSLPWSSKLRGGYIKSIIRDALRDMIPAPVVNRKSKIGFNTPLVDWLKRDWKEPVLDLMQSQAFNNCTLINPAAARKVVEGVIADPAATFEDGNKAWNSLIPFLWQEAIKTGTEQTRISVHD